jgi:hypothetical protein
MTKYYLTSLRIHHLNNSTNSRPIAWIRQLTDYPLSYSRINQWTKYQLTVDQVLLSPWTNAVCQLVFVGRTGFEPVKT